MTLEGAINLNETDSYIIYTMNSATTGQYGVVVPKNINGTINMLVDLHMKGSFDGVGSGTKTREQLVNEISEEYTKLKNRYSDGMLVMPMIDENMFQSAVINSDKQKMFDEVKKIGAITSELYKKLTESGVEKQKIDQKIIVVEKNQDDEKFVLWLKEQMPNFVDEIRYSELVGIQEKNEITKIYVKIDEQLIGTISLGDTIKEGTKEALRKDGALGIITGPLSSASVGITVAMVCGLIVAFITKPKSPYLMFQVSGSFL